MQILLFFSDVRRHNNMLQRLGYFIPQTRYDTID